MQKFATYQEFVKAQQALQPLLGLRQEDAQVAQEKRELLVCGDTGCRLTKSKELLAALREAISAAGLEGKVSAELTGCFGFCEKGPIIKVFPDNVVYFEVSPEDATEIVSSHLVKNKLVERLLYQDPFAPGLYLEFQNKMDFYKKQKPRALRNCGRINPREINEYIAADGYLALGKCLDSMKPEDVVNEMIASGLRGRGGGGYPTGLKWQAAAKQQSDKKYIVCNGDEGDPGAFMDRSIMEGDPHSLLEALAIGAYAIGANQGYVYIRAEYPLAIDSLNLAIDQATSMGLLGKNILGTDFSFDVEVKYGAGAFVCGEETALLHSIEGGRGEPTFKPPFPAEQGLFGKPTIINNVETLANIPPILLHGAEWFGSIGTAKSKGTKVFALAGKINNVGLVEVPMGISLREVIYEIGGGIKNGKKFKAVQTGGPSGGCIGPNYLDIKIDYESLGVIGSMMGSGGMIVMDEDNCMVDIAKFYLDFIMDESCGKCTPCRIGSKRLYEILCEITEGRGTMEHLEQLETLGHVMQDTALCGLGQTAANPVLSTLRHFKDEYIAHVKDKRCPAKVCRQLLDFTITDACIDCGRCIHECPVHCIEGVKRQYHYIDKTRCIKCGRCESVCPVKAIARG